MTRAARFSKSESMGNRFYSGILLIGVGFGLCGCVTGALWEPEALDGFNKPAHEANVQVSRYENDWLVEYNEVNEDSARVRRRTYALYANEDRVRGQKAPRFVKGTVATSGEVRAVMSDNGQEFTLYDGDTTVGVYALPMYPKPSGRVKQILLTPLTVAVDATIVSACVVVYAWGHSSTYSHCSD